MSNGQTNFSPSLSATCQSPARAVQYGQKTITIFWSILQFCFDFQFLNNIFLHTYLSVKLFLESALLIFAGTMCINDTWLRWLFLYDTDFNIAQTCSPYKVAIEDCKIFLFLVFPICGWNIKLHITCRGTFLHQLCFCTALLSNESDDLRCLLLKMQGGMTETWDFPLNWTWQLWISIIFVGRSDLVFLRQIFVCTGWIIVLYFVYN